MTPPSAFLINLILFILHMSVEKRKGFCGKNVRKLQKYSGIKITNCVVIFTTMGGWHKKSPRVPALGEGLKAGLALGH